MGTRRIFRRGGGAQNVKYPPCLSSPGIAWAALVKGSSAYSTKAELIPLFSGALLGCPLSVYAGTAGSMAGAPGRWLCRGRRLGGALLLSFSGRSSLSLLSRLSALSLPSPGRCWLCCLAGWGIASAGGGWVSLCPHAGLGCCAGFLGCRRWPLSSPCLASFPLLGAGSGVWCCGLPLSSLLGAGVPLLSSGAGLLCAGAGCWPWVG